MRKNAHSGTCTCGEHRYEKFAVGGSMWTKFTNILSWHKKNRRDKGNVIKILSGVFHTHTPLVTVWIEP